MIVCHSCGASLRQDSKFCDRCGVQLQTLDQPRTPYVQPPVLAYQPPIDPTMAVGLVGSHEMNHVNEWHVSPFNFVREVRSQMTPPQHVTIGDCTLREGEQASDITFSVEDKVMLARKLDELGLGMIQIGHARSASDVEAVKRVLKENLNAKIVMLASCSYPEWKDEIDVAIDSGADIIHTVHRTSDRALQQLKTSREDVLRTSKEVVDHAKSRGAFVEFGMNDAPRADFHFLKSLCTGVVDAGADRIHIADSVGCILPDAMRYMIRELKKVVKVPLRVHCHNDFGLAVANTLAAFQGGAEELDTTVNGLGDRTGNAPLAEVVAGLRILHDVDAGIRLDKLYEISQLVARTTKTSIPSSMPLVGEGAFTSKLDSHVRALLDDPLVVQPIKPEVVGNKVRVPLGTLSGPYAIKATMSRLGVKKEPSKDQLLEIVRRVEQEAVKKKRSITDEEFLRIFRAVVR